MIADHQSHYLHNLRAGLAILVTPLQVVATVPERIGTWFDDLFADKSRLQEKNRELEMDRVALKARLQRLSVLEKENARLRELLASAQRLPEKVLMAELVEVSLDPYNHKILVDRGLNGGAEVDQPVLDPEGVMGQLTQVMPFNSVVTLITDPSHATPVQVSRNNVHAVAFGIGKIDTLDINYLTPNADVQVGDELVTSGLGGRFPAGYPVARVKVIRRDPGAAFLQIQATPIARLDRARHVMLLLHTRTVKTDREMPATTSGGGKINIVQPGPQSDNKKAATQ